MPSSYDEGKGRITIWRVGLEIRQSVTLPGGSNSCVFTFRGKEASTWPRL